VHPVTDNILVINIKRCSILLYNIFWFVAFEKVCKFISENRDTVNAVSINFSVYQMMNPKVVQNVLKTIERFNLSPSNIIMEITESIFIDNYELVMKHMMELARAGVKFYLDDFGTGYSNLTNVISLPFSTIKMDRSLVLAMEEGQKGVSLFFDLVSTFKGVGFNILVEGVESVTDMFKDISTIPLTLVAGIS
jgi:EAL domain-containing protein (putative c-di-GMP-specific phosphodiesterase class I)